MDNLTTLLGGALFKVRKRDGSTEEVTVHELTIDQLPDMMAKMDNEPALVELFVAKEAGWALTLVRDDYVSLVELGDKINSDFFASWVRRRLRRQENAMPGILEKVTGSALASLSSSPLSPSKPA